jgi:hypothetical protein
MQTGTWEKSRHSSGAGQCVESRREGDLIIVRDSKDPQGPTLSFTTKEWAAHLRGVKKGDQGHGVL